MNERASFSGGVYDPRDAISPGVRALMQRRWTVAEIEALVAAGELADDEHFELIDGEIIALPAKGNFHEPLKGALIIHFAQRLPQDIRFIPETTFRFDVKNFVEPDIVFFRTADRWANLRSDTALLAVEVSDTSLSYDLGRKQRLYARFGVREVWVINAVKRETHVFRHPAEGGYAERLLVPPSETLVPVFAPQLAVCLDTLPLL